MISNLCSMNRETYAMLFFKISHSRAIEKINCRPQFKCKLQMNNMND